MLRFLIVLLTLLVLFGCDDDNGSNSDGDSVSIDVESEEKISATEGGFDGDLDSGDEFGRALTRLGNLDDKNSTDIAVGTPGDNREGSDSGAVWLLFLDEDADNIVQNEKKIPRDGDGFGGDLDSNDEFGSALATFDGLTLGAGDNDVEITLAVGAPGDDDGGDRSGAVWLLALTDEGKVEDWEKISSTGNSEFLDLNDDDGFGTAVANVDLRDENGLDDLAVGSPRARVGNSRTGAVWILSLETDGTIVSGSKIPKENDDFEDELSDGDRFGSAIADIGDLDGDGVNEIAVGAPRDEEGAVWILFMSAAGSVKDRQKISEDDGSFFGDLDDGDRFGSALAATGDLDGDDVPDLVVGAPGDIGNDDRTGAVWILFLSESGKVLAESKITKSKSGFQGRLSDGDGFGSALADLGDFDGDDSTELDLSVGAPGNNDGEGDDSGAVWLLYIDVESERNGGVLDSDDNRSDGSDDSLIDGILRDRELGSPLQKREFSSPLRKRKSGGLLGDRTLNSPLR